MLRLRFRQLDLLRHRRQPRLPRCRRNHHPDLHGHHHRQQQHTDTDTVRVTITGTNDAPQISAAIADFGFTEDANASAQALSSNGTLSFTDLDDNAVIDVSSAVTTNAVWSGGTIDASLASALEAGFNITGTDVAAPVHRRTYSVTDAHNLDFLDAGETITLTYTVTITDNSNDTDTDTVQVTITGTNDAPQISAAIAVSDSQKTRTLRRRLSPATALSPSQTSTTTLSSMSARPSPPMPSGAAAPSMLTRLRSGSRIQHLRHRCCGSGSVNWTYSVTDANLDFLGTGETITLTYTVTITDNNNDTDTTPSKSPSLAPTMPRRSPRQLLTSDSQKTRTLRRRLSPATALSPSQPRRQRCHRCQLGRHPNAVWSGTIDATPPPLWKPDSTSQARCCGSSSVNWTYSVTDANLDFLDAGETITLTYTVTITDNNNNDTDTDTVQVTITGTNDAPQDLRGNC